MRSDHLFDVADLDVGGVHQSVDTLDALDEFTTPADVESGTGGGRHAHSVHALDLACRGGVGVHRQHRRGPPVGVDQLGGQCRFDPLGAQHRRGGQAGDNPASARPQPGCDRALSCRKLRASRDVHGRVDRRVEPLKLPGRQRFGFDGFPPAQRPFQFIPHGRSVPPDSDTTGRLCRFVHRFGDSRMHAHSRAA